MSALGLEIAHELINALLVLSFAEAGQVCVEGGGDRTAVTEINLDLPKVLPLFKEIRGVRMAQGVHVRVFLDATGQQGKTESALESCVLDVFGCGGRTVMSLPLGRKEQSGVAMGFPLLTEQFEGALGQRNIAVAISFAAPDVEEHALGVDIAHLQAQAFAQTESTGVDRGQADTLIESLNLGENLADLGGG